MVGANLTKFRVDNVNVEMKLYQGSKRHLANYFVNLFVATLMHFFTKTL